MTRASEGDLMRIPVIVARCMVKRCGQGETGGDEFLTAPCPSFSQDL
jgi:hypothetical protein